MQTRKFVVFCPFRIANRLHLGTVLICSIVISFCYYYVLSRSDFYEAYEDHEFLFTESTSYSGFRNILPPPANKTDLLLRDSNKTSNASATSENRHPFEFLISEADFCKNLNPVSPLLLIIVFSAPSNFQNRKVIRETWADPNSSSYGLDSGAQMKVLFAIGLSKNKEIAEKIKFESKLHHDIIQEDFIDSYRNLTHKAVMMLKWVTHYCPEAFQILKTDDDIFINRFNLLKFIRKLFDNKTAQSKTLSCTFRYGRSKVKRWHGSKWYVSRDEYESDSYPPYCVGTGYMLSADLPKLFYDQALKMKFFPMEDIYVTAMLSEKIGNVTYQILGSSPVRSYSQVKNDSKISEYVIVHLRSSSTPLRDLWQRLLAEVTRNNVKQ